MGRVIVIFSSALFGSYFALTLPHPNHNPTLMIVTVHSIDAPKLHCSQECGYTLGSQRKIPLSACWGNPIPALSVNAVATVKIVKTVPVFCGYGSIACGLRNRQLDAEYQNRLDGSVILRLWNHQ